MRAASASCGIDSALFAPAPGGGGLKKKAICTHYVTGTAMLQELLAGLGLLIASKKALLLIPLSGATHLLAKS
jgi:hypothetical protein